MHRQRTAVCTAALSIALAGMIGGVAGGGGEPTAAGTVTSGNAPNVIFIMADDLGWGDLACYGNREIETPNIDALAADGVLFTRYYSCSPICSPARAAILAGQHPSEVGVFTAFAPTSDQNAARGMSDFLDPSVVVLPRMFQASGYATGHFGKWHLGSRQAPPLGDYGFDEHRSVLSANSNPQYDRSGPQWLTFSSEWIVSDAISFIDQHQSDPFFLQVWLRDPHAVVDPALEHLAVYPDLPPDTLGNFSSARHVYYSIVTALDKAVGELIDAVESRGLSDSTIIIFTSDNGPETIFSTHADHSGVGSAGPFRGRKRSLYEGGVRVPLIVRWPGQVPAGLVDDSSTIAAIDWVPTLAALTGTDCSILEPEVDCSQLDGEDMSLPILGFSHDRTTDILMEWRFGPGPRQESKINVSPDAAIIRDQWKLLLSRDGTREELYDVVEGFMETDNRRDSASFLLLAQLRQRLMSWRDQLPPCVGCENASDNSYPWPR